MTGKELQKELTWEFPHIGRKEPGQVEQAAGFCEGYKTFLNQGTTERECVKLAVDMLKEAGYQAFEEGKKYHSGEKV